MNKKIYLYGASGHCKVIINILELNNYEIINIIDDDSNKSSLLGYNVVNNINTLKRNESIIIAIGDNFTRRHIVKKLNNNFAFCIAIHPNSSINDNVKIDKGSVVMSNTVINSKTVIGKHCIVNTSSSIDHDCLIDDFTHIGPGVTLCGGVKIGKETLVGAGSVIIPNINIGNNVTIGAGSVIINNIPDNCVVVGNPGKILKQH